jgi:pteridine reductase
MGVALVTGAGVRVGRAIAFQLAQAGYDLHLHVNNSLEEAEHLQKQLEEMGRKAWVWQADLSVESQLADLVDQVQKVTPALDVLVNNAGLFERVPFRSITREAYRRMQEINLEAPFFLTQKLLDALEKARDPLVIMVGDIGGERPIPNYAHYSVSKAGLLMLTRALAVELAPRIRVNAVSPGTVAFPEDMGADTREKIIARIPMQREGSPTDIARVVRFLAEHAPYITGQVLNVDGGWTASL